MASTTETWMTTVALRLDDLCDRVVFVGGAILSLLFDDPASAPVRPTDDLDLIIDVASRPSYEALAEQLRKRGFQPDRSEGAPLCRWRIDGVVVDVMPTSEDILGFTNRWYQATIAHAVNHELGSGVKVRVASVPYFLATKLEAFWGRGEGDFVASHDLEDIIAVIDARSTVVDEIKEADDNVRKYLEASFSELLSQPAFVDALPGHLPGDEASQARAPIVEQRLRAIASLGI